MVVQGQADLLKVVLTFGPVGRLADLLDRGQQEPNEHGDHGDNDK
jgi:hypothetical protein